MCVDVGMPHGGQSKTSIFKKHLKWLNYFSQLRSGISEL